MIILVLLLILFIGLSGFFSAAETALMSLHEHKIKMLVDKRIKNAKLIKLLRSNTKKLLITILIGNNIVNIGASAISTKLAIDLFGNIGVGLATGVMVLIILIFGEITPKTMATSNAQKIALLVARPIYYIMILFMPITIIFEKITNYISKYFKSNDDFSEDEIVSMLRMGTEKRIIDLGQRKLMESILELDDISVKDIMVCNKDVFVLNENLLLKDILEYVNANVYSRIPLTDGKSISGFVHIKDILKNIKNNVMTLKEIRKDILKVNAKDTIDNVFELMQETGIHIAVVENNKFVGIVTMEDIIEEIFGEIYDEYDITAKEIIKINKNTIMAHVNTKMDDIFDFFDYNNKTKYDDNTLMEFLKSKISRFAENQKIKYKKLVFEIESLVNNKPRLVKIKRIKKE